MMRLEDKVAIVTGGGSGIGAATARRFAAEGARVVVTGRRPEPLQQIADEIGGLAVPGDTASRYDVEAAVDAARTTFGGLDVVVAAAGVSPAGTVGDIDDGVWQRCLDVNLTGPMMMARAALPAMLAGGGGTFVLISSTAGLAAAPSSVAYDVSKAGVLALVRNIAVDFGPQGVRANALVPGWVRTPMADRSMDALAAERGSTREDAYVQATGQVPAQRPADADEMAACCVFLASDESSYVNGTTLVADGGGLAVELTSTDFTFGGQSA
jgi:NAD(P)-dependent dehydrogenase (short-subunit alcohol dehydrogenase family)